MSRRLELALFNEPVGRHPGGWRLPGAQGRADDVDWVVHTARLAEDALFDLFFCEDALAAPRPGHDGPVRAIEPLTLLAAVARETRHIGWSRRCRRRSASPTASPASSPRWTGSATRGRGGTR